jgi:hypothetical protein
MSLPRANLKEEAYLVREKYMHDLFGRLPDAPKAKIVVASNGVIVQKH